MDKEIAFSPGEQGVGALGDIFPGDQVAAASIPLECVRVTGDQETGRRLACAG